MTTCRLHVDARFCLYFLPPITCLRRRLRVFAFMPRGDGGAMIRCYVTRVMLRR